MKHSNEFMLMAINRCIDYTKADKGVKLVPKLETIDLLETLSLHEGHPEPSQYPAPAHSDGDLLACDHRQAVAAGECAVSAKQCRQVQ
jgi:hypothetical protein